MPPYYGPSSSHITSVLKLLNPDYWQCWLPFADPGPKMLGSPLSTTDLISATAVLPKLHFPLCSKSGFASWVHASINTEPYVITVTRKPPSAVATYPVPTIPQDFCWLVRVGWFVLFFSIAYRDLLIRFNTIYQLCGSHYLPVQIIHIKI